MFAPKLIVAPKNNSFDMVQVHGVARPKSWRRDVTQRRRRGKKAGSKPEQ